MPPDVSMSELSPADELEEIPSGDERPLPCLRKGPVLRKSVYPTRLAGVVYHPLRLCRVATLLVDCTDLTPVHEVVYFLQALEVKPFQYGFGHSQFAIESADLWDDLGKLLGELTERPLKRRRIPGRIKRRMKVLAALFQPPCNIPLDRGEWSRALACYHFSFREFERLLPLDSEESHKWASLAIADHPSLPSGAAVAARQALTSAGLL